MTTAGCPHPAHAPATVRLWDGRDHCVDCVERACPGLAGFARERDRLEDAIPYDRRGGLVAWAKMAGLLSTALALVGAGSFAAMDATSAGLLVGAMAAVLAVTLLGTLPSVFKAGRVLPAVRVVDGLVEVFRPSHARGRNPVATYPLGEARWHVGRVVEDSSCRGKGGAIVPDRPAIVLRAPRKWKGVAPPSEFTAIGSSPELVRLWAGFLRLVEVPEGR